MISIANLSALWLQPISIFIKVIEYFGTNKGDGSQINVWTNFINWFKSRGDKKWNDKNEFYFQRGKNDNSDHYRGPDSNSPGYNTVHTNQESFDP